MMYILFYAVVCLILKGFFVSLIAPYMFFTGRFFI